MWHITNDVVPIIGVLLLVWVLNVLGIDETLLLSSRGLKIAVI